MVVGSRAKIKSPKSTLSNGRGRRTPPLMKGGAGRSSSELIIGSGALLAKRTLS